MLEKPTASHISEIDSELYASIIFAFSMRMFMRSAIGEILYIS